MKTYSPYKNIYFYYRGLTPRIDFVENSQIEDNTTKALINTLQFSDISLVRAFLKALNMNIQDVDEYFYSLQIAKQSARPDGLILAGKSEIYIESKVKAPLLTNQIINHLLEINDAKLVCITKNKSDIKIVEQINNPRVKHLTWETIYKIFQKQLTKIDDPSSKFLIKQFLEYLEIINMAPFTGWNRKDFEAFLFIDTDPDKMLRLRVKEKLYLYLEELFKELSKEEYFKDHEFAVGNLANKGDSIWGVICKSPYKTVVHKPHFGFYLNSDNFMIGIQIEGKTPSTKTFDLMKKHPEKFVEMFRKLEGFTFYMWDRIEKGVRNYQEVVQLELQLNEKIDCSDIEYLVSKSTQYKFFIYRVAKTLKRDDKDLDNEQFFVKSIETIKKLKDFYDFVSV